MSLELDRPFIIAESGTCHASGNVETRYHRSMKYVHASARAKADAIKFQMFDNPTRETMFCWMDGDDARAERWRQSAMSFNQWLAIKCEAESCGIAFLASAFEYETVEWLSELNVCATKVASRAAPHLDEFTNAPRPLLISNGMTKVDLDKDHVILECEAQYPSTARWTGKFPGFSDHSGNPWRAIDALAGGCKLIEVHYFLDPVHAGPDCQASLNIEGLELICRARDAFATFT